MKKLIFILFISFLFAGNSYSQGDLGSVLQKVGQEYTQKYLAPFTTGVGTNLNSGFLGGYGPSAYSKIPVWPHVYAGVKFCGVLMEDKDKVFNVGFTTNESYNGVPVTVDWTVYNAPTVFGDTKPAVATGKVRGTNQTITKELIGGIDNSKFVPLFIPQIGIGTLVGTDIIFRTIPGISVGNYGYFKLFGGALRHNIGGYVKMPFDIAVQFGYQSFGITDQNDVKFISANSMFANLQINKTFSIVSIYGGAQYENYSVDVNYRFGNTLISYNQTGDNSFRGIIGTTISIGPAKFNADVNLGSKFTFTVGIGAGL